MEATARNTQTEELSEWVNFSAIAFAGRMTFLATSTEAGKDLRKPIVMTESPSTAKAMDIDNLRRITLFD